MSIQRRGRGEGPGVLTYLILSLMVLPLTQSAKAGGITVGGGCSLADAITAANTDAAAGGCVAGNGPDTLTLTEDVVLSNVVDSSSLYGKTGLPRVTSSVTIEGGDFVIERDPSAPPFRIFLVWSAGSLTLRHLTVRNGSASEQSAGGAVFARGFLPELHLEHVTLTNNRARSGGAIYIDDGSMTIAGSTISGNSAEGVGGGIFCTQIVRISGSTISENRANHGGGIRALQAVLVIEDTTISGNEALRGGGGVSHGEGVLVISNATISGNRGGVLGGGVWVESGPTLAQFEARHVTILDNTAARGSGIWFKDYGIGASAKFVGSIVVGGGGGLDCEGDTPIADNGGNFGGDGSCGAGFAPITPGIDIDGTLLSNGGPTRTHALLDGSPAIDAAGACGLARDQRGVPRSDGACDSGAFEFEESLLVIMASMSARPTAEGVAVRWTTATEIDVAGFRVLRASGPVSEKAASKEYVVPVSGWIPAAGTALNGASYEWVDGKRRDPRAVRYYVEETDRFGRTTRHGPVVPSGFRTSGG